eukprot:INCI3243.1.p2 GENE.INCI3243.1~~INCI3243.1.p2  ORF type:complete len:193 (+),score=28.45 INCI3243.1:146-724(+)
MSVSFGQHAKTLLMQLKQSDWLPEYNTPTVRSALSEANALSKEITDTLKEMNYEIKDASVAARLTVYREAVIRNRKCLLAYVQHRSAKIRSLRWQVGHPLPQKFRDRMSPEEYKYFTGYDEILNEYLKDMDLDLATNVTPPKSLYITVRAIVDCGEIVGEDGTSIRLEKFSENLVRRQDVELLIKQGHVIEV